MVHSFWCDVYLAHLAIRVTVFCQNHLKPSQCQLNKDNGLQVTVFNSVSSIDDDICEMGVFCKESDSKSFELYKALYPRFRCFLRIATRTIDSDCNPDISHHRLFGHAQKALIRERCMSCLKKLQPPTPAQKSCACQYPCPPFLIAQDMALMTFCTTKCAISQSKNKLVKIIS